METASMMMEVEAVTHTLYWLAERKDGQKTQAVILTDSMSLLQRVEKESILSKWIHVVQQISEGWIRWIYCPGQAGVQGIKQAVKLAGTAGLTNGLALGRSEVLRQFRNILKREDQPEHHIVDQLMERSV